MLQVHRDPVWSQFLTAPLSARIPAAQRPKVLVAIKAFHTIAFFSIGAMVALFAWDGIRQRPSRRTGIAAAVALGETLVYVSNNQVCPLTPLAEQFGAESGSVVDLFLPRWISQRIPPISGSALLVGLAANLLALRRRR
jgi:hypothetical protein